MSRDGHAYSCKQCIKQYKLDNKERLSEYSKAYIEENRDKIRKYKSEYYKDNKDHLIKKDIERNLKKRKESDFEKLKHNIRSNILRAYKNSGFKKSLKTTEILGCSLEQLKIHLDNTFYNNYGRSLSCQDNIHIDHIKPVSIAKTEDELVELNHYTNLQLLLAEDNLSKGNKNE